ncbi:MAG: hypothetical protein M3018_07555, partial [Actinomycetota bacterium]|nr:hypothetical protein [Actinomycetota bacterium]
IFPGVYHWTTFHQPIRSWVSSYYVEPAGVVIDPKIPEGGLGSLPGEPRAVLLTSGHHDRDADSLAKAFGIPIRVSRKASDYLGVTLDVEVFDDGEEVVPGVSAIHIGKLSDDEGAFHIAVGDGAIAFADGLIRYAGELGFVPDELIGDDPESVKRGLKEVFRGLLTRDFDHLLVAHGEPLVVGGKEALREFAGSA